MKILEETAEYAQDTDEDRPLRSYAGLIAAYSATTAGLLAVAWRRGRLATRPSAGDVALLAVATHRMSRTLSKDAIASPIRAPFTRFEGPGGPGEVQEAPRALGLRHAIGELLGCPFCIGQWVATGFVAGYLFAPRPTRWVATVFAVKTGSDFLQYALAAAQKAATGPQPAT